MRDAQAVAAAAAAAAVGCSNLAALSASQPTGCAPHLASLVQERGRLLCQRRALRLGRRAAAGARRLLNGCSRHHGLRNLMELGLRTAWRVVQPGAQHGSSTETRAFPTSTVDRPAVTRERACAHAALGEQQLISLRLPLAEARACPPRRLSGVISTSCDALGVASLTHLRCRCRRHRRSQLTDPTRRNERAGRPAQGPGAGLLHQLGAARAGGIRGHEM